MGTHHTVRFSERYRLYCGTRHDTGAGVSNRRIASILSVILRVWCKVNNLHGSRCSVLNMEAGRSSEKVSVPIYTTSCPRIFVSFSASLRISYRAAAEDRWEVNSGSCHSNWWPCIVVCGPVFVHTWSVFSPFVIKNSEMRVTCSTEGVDWEVNRKLVGKIWGNPLGKARRKWG